MKMQKNIFTLLTGMILGLSTISVADDTDLYLGRDGAGSSAATEGARPNLMFVLDTSGSMAFYDDGAEGSRMTRMRTGLREVLLNASNVNVGLMRFHTNQGGPVLYPVRYIDEVVEDLSDAEHDVSVRVGHGTDDAEEGLGTGDVVTDDTDIEIGRLPGTVTSTSTTDRNDQGWKSDAYAIGVNDGMEFRPSGQMKTTTVDLDLGYDISPTTDTLVGMRFRDVKIPAGATIAYAVLTTYSQTPTSLSENKDTNLTIHAHDIGNSGNIANNNNNLSSRTKTSASVAWEGIAKATARRQPLKTPNLAPVIQEVVSRGDWSAGNAITLLIEGDGRRRIYSDNGAAAEGAKNFSPQLEVYYTFPGQALNTVQKEITYTYNTAYQYFNTIILNSSRVPGPYFSSYYNQVYWGLQWRDINIPKNAIILGSEVEFGNYSTHSTYNSDLANAVFRLEDSSWMLNFYSTRNSSKIAGRTLVADPSTSSGYLEALWRYLPGFGTDGFGKKVTSWDISNLVQHQVNRSDWAPGKRMTLVVANPHGNTPQGRRRYATAPNSADVDGPILRVWHTMPMSTSTTIPGEDQRVGVRLRNVDIPQGAKITEAYLDFTSSGGSTGNAQFLIHGELEANAQTYSNDGSTPSLAVRNVTGSTQGWEHPSTLSNWTADNQIHTTPDVSSIVQEIVDQSDWCGGNAMSFLLDTAGTGKRVFKSWENDPTKAPVLRVKYKLEGIGPGEGCTRKTVTKQIFGGNDDGTEWLKYNSMTDNGTTLNLGRLAGGPTQHNDYAQLVGLRWGGMQIPTNAEIIEANLTLYSKVSSDSESVNWEIWGESPGNINDPAGNFDWVNKKISERTVTPVSVNWSFNDVWNIDKAAKESPEVTPIIQHIVNQPGWRYGDPMVLVIGGTGKRNAYSFDGDPAKGAKLTISYRANLGDTPEVNSVRTVRDVLIDTVDGLSAFGSTPLVDTYWEAARYMTGMEVLFGKTRGAGVQFSATDVKPNSWSLNEAHSRSVSHPDSWTGGTIKHDVGAWGNCAETWYSGCVDEPSQCSAANSGHYSCRTEYIDGNPTYIEPSVENCTGSHIVLLTDGVPNSPHSHWSGGNPDGIPETLGLAECNNEIPLIDDDGNVINPATDVRELNEFGGETCGKDLALWLTETDHDDDVAGVNGIKTHTIGFNLPFNLPVDPDNPTDSNATTNARNKAAIEFLKEVANQGEGEFYTAGSTQELVEAFSTILADAIREEGSFTAPSLSVNSFNRLYNRPTAFLTTFESNKKAVWDGNIKKFRVCPFFDNPTVCEFGQLIDVNDNEAVITNTSSDNFGMLRTDLADVWDGSGLSSARAVVEGGTGANVKGWQDRVVYTSLPTTPENTGTATNVQGTPLTALDAVRDMQTGDRDDIRIELAQQGLCGSGAVVDEDCLDRVIKFMMGGRTKPDSQTISASVLAGVNLGENRWPVADSLHSQPVVISYGSHADTDDENNDGDTAENIPLSKVMWGTNDGAIHFIDETTGEEEWIFYPNEVLARMETVENNADTSDHNYGMDASPVTRVYDDNGDGIITPSEGDFVHVYMGMRRGGRSLYAINVTPNAVITNTSQRVIEPKLLWSITGEDSDGNPTPGYELLGQTWSTPHPVRLPVKDANGNIDTRVVLIFGGGHESTGKDTFESPADGAAWNHGGNSNGNAIYIVDAETGERLWAATGPVSDTVIDSDIEDTDMKFSFTADLTLIDGNHDGFIDRIYGVDLAGQVWRVDLRADLSDSTIGRLATLGHAPDVDGSGVADRTHSRRFYYAPAVAQVQDSDFSSGDGRYDVVAVLSGNRADPLDEDVLNRAYVLRDYLVDDQIASGGGNYPFCNPAGAGCAQGTPYTDMSAGGASALFDVSNSIVNAANTEDTAGSTQQADLETMRGSHGWFFDLTIDTGEKGFAPMTIYDGKIYFPTFVPPKAETDASVITEEECTVSIGTSYLYSVDVLTGAPVNAAWMGDDNTALETDDRVMEIGDGPSGQAVVIRLEEGSTVLVPHSGGAPTAQDSSAASRPPKTFWYQQ